MNADGVFSYSNQRKLRDNAGLVSGTVSPMTLPSSTDDNFHQDEWTPFQMQDPMVGIPLDAPLFYPYAKDTATSTNTVIVDDMADIQHGQEYSDFPSDQVASFRAFQYPNGSWTDASNSPATQSQFPVSMPLESLEDGVAAPNDFPGCGWFEGLDMHLPANLMSSFPVISPDMGFSDDFQQTNKQSQNGSASPSVAEDISGVFDNSYSSTNGDVPAFMEQQLKEDNSQYMEWNNASPEDMSQMLPKTGAFIANQGLPKSPSDALSSRSRGMTSMAHRGVIRHTPIPLQPVAAARKRRQRNSSISIEQQPQPKPLQIVQEDGQGGSISSEDFVSPPRGARRKGPLSVVGRANAGLRRKNKDTCVQCRMNKRKVRPSFPRLPSSYIRTFLRIRLTENPSAMEIRHVRPAVPRSMSNLAHEHALLVLSSTGRVIISVRELRSLCHLYSANVSIPAQRAINHPTLGGSSRVRMEIPSAFDLNDLLAFLSERRGKFNIRARQAWGSLYVLDLGETYKFLRSLSEYNGNSQSTFLEFIDRRIIESKDRSKNWLSCVKDCDPMNNIFVSLARSEVEGGITN